MKLQDLERDDFECALVGRSQDHGGGRTVLMGPQPVEGSHAPAIAGNEPREPIGGHGGAEVVADAALVLEEFRSHDGADRVSSLIVGPRTAASVAIEPGDGICATRIECLAQNVLLGHGTSIAANGHGTPIASDR